MLRSWFRPLLLTAGVLVGVGVLSGCGQDTRSQMDVDLGAIKALADAATREAQAMEEHAGIMAAAAAGRPDLAHWQSDADGARASAKSLRLVAGWAHAIHFDPGARRDSTADVQRVFGDGTNLQQLGEALITQAAATQGHLEFMRDQARGDATLTASITQLLADTTAMKQRGAAAVERGKALETTARERARALGTKLE